jgi:putative heme-binding domain-containing protein
MRKNTSTMMALAAAVAACILTGPASAQDYPSRTVTLVVPYPPGGGVDVLARVVAGKLSGLIGQQVIVDNRVGGSGIVGTRAFIRSAPDGYTLFLGHTAAMCSKCHALKPVGEQIGPTLQGVARRLTRDELLESMLDPGAKVASGYGIQVLTLNDGGTATGTQMSETNEAIVLKSPDGKLSTYPKTNIKAATKPIGAMPPMKSLLTIREMRDLVAFLSTLGGVVD